MLLCDEQEQVQRLHSPCGPGFYAGALLEGWGCSEGHWRQAPTCFHLGFLQAKSWVLKDGPYTCRELI